MSLISRLLKVMVPFIFLIHFVLVLVQAVGSDDEAHVPVTASSSRRPNYKAPVFSGLSADWAVFEMLFTSFLFLTACDKTAALINRPPRTIINANAANGPIVNADDIAGDKSANEGLFHMLLQCIQDKTLVSYIIPHNRDGHAAYAALTRRCTGNPTDHLNNGL